MATLAAWCDWIAGGRREPATGGMTTARAVGAAPAYGSYGAPRTPDYRLRAFPNEDVYFWVKHVDNSRVVREEDPQAPKVCWKLIGGASVAAVLLIGLLLPSAYALMAGYRLQGLKSEQARLKQEITALDLEEARLLSPENLARLAEMQELYDPEPGRVIYLEKPGDGSLAMRPPAPLP